MRSIARSCQLEMEEGSLWAANRTPGSKERLERIERELAASRRTAAAAFHAQWQKEKGAHRCPLRAFKEEIESSRQFAGGTGQRAATTSTGPPSWSTGNPGRTSTRKLAGKGGGPPTPKPAEQEPVAWSEVTRTDIAEGSPSGTGHYPVRPLGCRAKWRSCLHLEKRRLHQRVIRPGSRRVTAVADLRFSGSRAGLSDPNRRSLRSCFLDPRGVARRNSAKALRPDVRQRTTPLVRIRHEPNSMKSTL